MIPQRVPARVLLATFLLLAAVHLAVQLLGPGAWSRPTQVLLMPALFLTVLAAAERPRPRLVELVLTALVLSWLGDSLPALADGDAGFLLMVAGFLVAQVVYVFAFWPYRSASVLHRRRWLLVPYVGAVAALVWACVPYVGGLLVPVLVYGLVLGLMAVAATGVNAWTGVGGALFLVSDALIALRSFVPGFDVPQGGFWVMATYVAAQALIALGVLRRIRSSG
ncbi:lysoplasmalogenase [Nocardiopsis halotolerans]|uniref:lysoplasmalogenase n=1 Tax=Nocardiopsis halotolerans TaxID=124252 RepID=UPI00034897C9|nr:lysoplasmalogenase [Nocardiopsis halotolerans]